MVCQCLSPLQVKDAGYVDSSVRQEISKSSRVESCSFENSSRNLKRKIDRQIETPRERLFWAAPFIVSKAHRRFLTPIGWECFPRVPSETVPIFLSLFLLKMSLSVSFLKWLFSHLSYSFPNITSPFSIITLIVNKVGVFHKYDTHSWNIWVLIHCSQQKDKTERKTRICVNICLIEKAGLRMCVCGFVFV